ncbi:MAG: hypothetical protein ACE5FT_06195 [Candidatus Nanoarchaeia archaeon]
MNERIIIGTIVIILLASSLVAGNQHTAQGSYSDEAWDQLNDAEQREALQDGIPVDRMNSYIKSKFGVKFDMPEGLTRFKFENGKLFNGKASLDLSTFKGSAYKITPLAKGGFSIDYGGNSIDINTNQRISKGKGNTLTLPPGGYRINGQLVTIKNGEGTIDHDSYGSVFNFKKGTTVVAGGDKGNFQFSGAQTDYSLKINKDDIEFLGALTVKTKAGDTLIVTPMRMTLPADLSDWDKKYTISSSDGRNLDAVKLWKWDTITDGESRRTVSVWSDNPVTVEIGEPSSRYHSASGDKILVKADGDNTFVSGSLSGLQGNSMLEVSAPFDGKTYRYEMYPFIDPDTETMAGIKYDAWYGSQRSGMRAHIDNPPGNAPIEFDVGNLPYMDTTNIKTEGVLDQIGSGISSGVTGVSSLLSSAYRWTVKSIHRQQLGYKHFEMVTGHKTKPIE